MLFQIGSSFRKRRAILAVKLLGAASFCIIGNACTRTDGSDSIHRATASVEAPLNIKPSDDPNLQLPDNGATTSKESTRASPNQRKPASF